VPFAATWRLADQRVWRYDGTMQLVPTADTWAVRWRPSVIHPELAAQQTLALREERPDLAPVLDRDGAPLLVAETVPQFSSTGSHGWFVGYRGDVAFAVLVVDADSSAPAVETAVRFLTAVDRE